MKRTSQKRKGNSDFHCHRACEIIIFVGMEVSPSRTSMASLRILPFMTCFRSLERAMTDRQLNRIMYWSWTKD